MRTGNHTQRPIIGTALVQVEPDGEHAIHEICWGLYVQDSTLHRPRTKSINILTFANGDGQILMPNDLPICALGLVEKNPSDSKALGPEGSRHEITDAL